MLSIYEDGQKKTIQYAIFNVLAQRDASPQRLCHVIGELESFLSHNVVTDRLQRQIELQNDNAQALARSVAEFLLDSRTSEQERGRVLAGFGRETLATLDGGEDFAVTDRKLRTLVTEMLAHYRDQALAWEEKARELERIVNVDPLLAPLHNRRALDEQLQKAVAKADADGAPLSVFMIDVDNFKTTINDVHGHQVGDDVLRTLAKIINGYAVKYDWFAARYGGDELVLVCALDADQAQFFAEAIRLAVQQYEFRPRIGGKLQDHPIRFTVSIGVAEYQPGMSWPDLLGEADNAMYQVKGTGKNNVTRYRRPPCAT
jgi:two-component system, cell cycle response regulator